MSLTETFSPTRWIDSRAERPVLVTGREHEAVWENFRIPEKYFKNNPHVLSVGEGLSDFARQLHDKRDVDILSIDPIYCLGEKIFNKNPKEVTMVLSQSFNTKVLFEERHQKNPKEIPLPDLKRIIAGSVYELPFPNESFDLVLSHRVFEHVDVARALPEMVRVTAPNGELRMGGTLLNVDFSQKRLYLGTIRYDKNYEYYYIVPHDDLHQGMEKLREKPPSAYIMLNGLPKQSKVRDGLGFYVGGLFILRKDQQLPEIEMPEAKDSYPMQPHSIIHYEHLGKLLKIDPTSLEKDPEFGSYYTLEPVVGI